MYPLVASISTMDAISSGFPSLPMGIMLCRYHGIDKFVRGLYTKTQLTLTASEGLRIISVSAY